MVRQHDPASPNPNGPGTRGNVGDHQGGSSTWWGRSSACSSAALAGQSAAEIGRWFEQTTRSWNAQPTPFVSNGKRRQRRRRRPSEPLHPLGGSGACTCQPLLQPRSQTPAEYQIPGQMTQWFFLPLSDTGPSPYRTASRGRSASAISLVTSRARCSNLDRHNGPQESGCSGGEPE